MSGGSSFLRMEGITKRYGGTTALDGVSFSADLGEVHAIVGENGAGKSTLMNVLSGTVKPDSGHVSLGGERVSLSGPHHANLLGIRAVHQEFSLVPQLEVAENILLGRLPTRGRGRLFVDWAAARSRAGELLDELGFGALGSGERVSRLSVSQRQVVEIAKSLAERPKVLILDEPSAVLGKEELAKLFGLIKRLRSEGTLILYISHRLDEIFDIADRITALRDGKVVGTVPRESVGQDELIRMMVGRTIEEIYPKRSGGRGGEALAVAGLGREGCYSGVSFSLRRGEILGVFGLVGSGRSSLARGIFGAEPATSGEIAVGGRRFRPRSPREAVEAGISLVTEDRKRDGLVMSCSIRDNVSLASLRLMSLGPFIRRGLQDGLVSGKVRELAVKPARLGVPARSLSGGNQQKVILAKWLLRDTRVLVLDEPTRGVDIGAKVEIYGLINELASRGAGILLISSEMPEVLGMSDRVLVMREGRLAGEVAGPEASEERLLQLASGYAEGVRGARGAPETRSAGGAA